MLQNRSKGNYQRELRLISRKISVGLNTSMSLRQVHRVNRYAMIFSKRNDVTEKKERGWERERERAYNYYRLSNVLKMGKVPRISIKQPGELERSVYENPINYTDISSKIERFRECHSLRRNSIGYDQKCHFSFLFEKIYFYELMWFMKKAMYVHAKNVHFLTHRLNSESLLVLIKEYQALRAEVLKKRASFQRKLWTLKWERRLIRRAV